MIFSGTFVEIEQEEYPDVFKELDWLEDQLSDEQDDYRIGTIERLIDSITLSLEAILDDVKEAHDLLD
jgi:hypothetical protein